MSDAVFYLLDALLGAARGILISNRANNIQKEYGLENDPRSGITKKLTSPVGSALFNVVSSFALTKDMEGNANVVSSASGRHKYI